MDKISCAQFHYCKAVMEHISLCLTYNKVDILLNQELYCYNGIPCLILPNYTPYYVRSDENPRAYLLIAATATNPPLYLASSYLPPYDTLEQEFTPIKSFVTSIKPTNFIWGLDSNSKHSRWHSPITDSKGKKLTEFISLHSLITVNEKHGPTFSGALGDSWIDITVTTVNIVHKIQNWHVSKEKTQSDHNIIIYDKIQQCPTTNITRQANHSARKFPTQVGQWNLFQQKIQQVNNNWLDKIKNPTIKNRRTP